MDLPHRPTYANGRPVRVLTVAATLGAAVLACRPLAADRRQPPEVVDVGRSIQKLAEADWLDADRHFGSDREAVGAARGEKPAGVTTAEDAVGGCDGVKDGRFGFHTASGEQDPWWQVDLGRVANLHRVVVYNRTGGKVALRTRNLRILVAGQNDQPEFSEVYRHDGEAFYGAKDGPPLVVDFSDRKVPARIVRLHVPGRCSFALDEVEVYGADDPSTNVALGKPADQKSVGPYSCPGTKGHEYVAPRPAGGTVPIFPQGKWDGPLPGPFSLTHTRAVIDRASRLADRLRPMADAERLEPLVAELEKLEGRLAGLGAAAEAPEPARREIYLTGRRLLRRIAWTNPRLAIDRLLFIKRHPAGGLYHMVHQYYGFCATPGGGLFVLENPCSESPKLVNLLADTVVGNGRLKGKKLEGGSFLAPEVSFDGREILVAYTESQGDRIAWTPETCYHIFKVRADGTGLEQLTDGPWNDFDPCFLPDGRVAFISGRRGGYLRCGGSSPPYHSPTYTLFSMEPDGSDIVCLSFHETQEWHPSVNHAGMIVYTRWDYVDRDTNVAHHIWTCHADGRDPRSPHGNYPVERESRPWMEMSIRAVPGSHRYVATAAPHHGHAFGSLVLLDPRIEDDGATSQVERVTPNVPFPEAERNKKELRGAAAYGTAWPLSEDDYLCVYARDGENFGIYWVDRDGNRELLYRDPEISCLSPMPLRARRRPPVVAPQTTRTASGKTAQDGEATVAVMNVYDSDFTWPPGTKIDALRVLQVLPKTTPRYNRPRIGVAAMTNARASLGTVPVEPDGSAFFEAPVGKLIYFQALDDQGMAVQSMRSGTYVHPGERLVCQGCHERKHRPPTAPEQVPLALLREPSKIVPEAEGSNPFSYVRLVQPVLDAHCVECHREKKALDLSGAIEGEHGWSRSYANLAGAYGFYYHSGNGSIRSAAHGGSRTTAGEFGARASKLLEYLGPEHYGVELPPEDRRRITLWLDCNSEFYGAYEEIARQARGEVVRPLLD